MWHPTSLFRLKINKNIQIRNYLKQIENSASLSLLFASFSATHLCVTSAGEEEDDCNEDNEDPQISGLQPPVKRSKT